jgi:Rha family phage regulatory protein
MQSTELVTLQGDVPMTTSRIVAEVFGKQHKDVLESIDGLISDMRRRLDAQDETKSSACKDPDEHFIPTLTEVSIGSGATRRDRGYNLTQIGFTLLAFGFQGEKALDFKCQFIDAFVDLTHQNIQLLKQNEALQKRLVRKLEKDNQLLLTDNTTIAEENVTLVAAVQESKRVVTALNSVVADFMCDPSKVKDRIDVGVCREQSRYRAEVAKLAKAKGSALLGAHALLVDRLKRRDPSILNDAYITEPLSSLKACARAMTYISDSVWESMGRDAKKSAKVLREIEDADAEYAA